VCAAVSCRVVPRRAVPSNQQKTCLIRGFCGGWARLQTRLLVAPGEPEAPKKQCRDRVASITSYGLDDVPI